MNADRTLLTDAIWQKLGEHQKVWGSRGHQALYHCRRNAYLYRLINCPTLFDALLETPTFAPARWVLFTAAPDF
ncbi:hypothetical protein QMK33_23440, partial [Hymenobacter sp. H14-R3]|uniref:hypothetical protein n=1 Tax=Hymenobacter sp. H14-R3 TaxID=3046308 RepID=UPI0024B8A9EF